MRASHVSYDLRSFQATKTYFLLSEGSKSLIIKFFLFTELDSIKNITMLKKLPDHFNVVLNYFQWFPLNTALVAGLCKKLEFSRTFDFFDMTSTDRVTL